MSEVELYLISKRKTVSFLSGEKRGVFFVDNVREKIF